LLGFNTLSGKVIFTLAISVVDGGEPKVWHTSGHIGPPYMCMESCWPSDQAADNQSQIIENV